MDKKEKEEKETKKKESGTIDNFKKKAEEYLNGWRRCQADFENYKKQQEKNKKDLIRYSAENILTQILPVLDNFQAAVKHIPERQKKESWTQGIMHIQKQLETILADNGVEEIQIKTGDDFNPEFCEAIKSGSNDTSKHQSDSSNEIKIIKIILKGYKIGDRIIRPARVAVK